MDWTSLGHACWMIEAAGLRLLVDPLLSARHHRGLFTVNPPRALDAPALRPDYLLISHAHPDHFDVPSLRALALLDPDTVLLTPDPLVAWAADRLGFSTTRVVPPSSQITLDGLRLLTTPSSTADEWGLLVEHDGATAWHLIDTTPSADEARQFQHEAGTALGILALPERGPDLALLMGQPLQEVALALGDPLRFPERDYARQIDLAAAMRSATVVASSADSVHAPAHAAMNAVVYPQTEARFRRDLAARSPRLRTLPRVLGGRYHVAPGRVDLDPDAHRSLLRDLEPALDTTFRPFAPPPLRDPNPGGYPRAAMQDTIDRWVRGPLADALRRALAPSARAWSLTLLVTHATDDDAYTLHLDGSSLGITRDLDPDHDLLNAVAASSLVDVIAGRASWADVLLAGLLRVSDRAYEVSAGGLRGGLQQPIFVYHALPYEESVRRAVEHEVEAVLGEI